MKYYVVNTTAETVTILEMLPTQERAHRYTTMMQPWFEQSLQIVRATELHNEGKWQI